MILKQIRRKFILYNKLKKGRLAKYFCIRTPKNEQEYNAMYALRYLVYCEEYKYLDAKNYPQKKEYDIYDTSSIHYILVDKRCDEKIIGTIRIIKNSINGFPIENNFKLQSNLDNINEENIVEISRLMVSKKYRSQYLTLDLVKKLYQYAKENNITHVYAVMDDNLYIPLMRMGFTFKKIGQVSDYQGKTTPCLLVITDLEKNLFRKNKIMLNYLQREF